MIPLLSNLKTGLLKAHLKASRVPYFLYFLLIAFYFINLSPYVSKIHLKLTKLEKIKNLQTGAQNKII